jgi:adenosine deaminase
MSVLDDPELLKNCIDNNIPFTFCPQSILSFNQLEKLNELRVKEILDMGL